MPTSEFYKQRLYSLQTELEQLSKRKTLLGWLRLASIIGAATGFYFLFPLGALYAAIPAALLLILFTRLVLADLKNKFSIKHLKNLVQINEDELTALNSNYFHFRDGSEYNPKEHPYANDLDMFGHASVFQLINRTNSEPGSDVLANWLLYPAQHETIMKRQSAIKELSANSLWRQELQAFGASEQIKKSTISRLEVWFGAGYNFINRGYWIVASYLVPFVVVTVLILNFSDVLTDYTRNYFLFAAAVFAFFVSKKVTRIHQQVSKITGELEVLINSIKHIEKISFQSACLQDLQKSLIEDGYKASVQISQLKKILERLDIRFNFVVFIPLNILLQWDLQQVISLEKWKLRNHQKTGNWFKVLAEFEALSSFATLHFNNPGWCFPVFKEDHFFIEGKEIGHPLIQAGKCIYNPVQIEKQGEIMLVTGSNMAGKSTYLRSIGVNSVLAMAGSPVCAAYFCLSPVQIISSMRIADNLEESTSTFYAELKKLKTIIDKVNRKEKVFILLDEILRGTNSLDRHTGSAALIKQLIKLNAACIIATHDVELARLKEVFPANILNYHFDVQVSNDELYFDYRLKEGICTSLNASILMKKIGIEL